MPSLRRVALSKGRGRRLLSRGLVLLYLILACGEKARRPLPFRLIVEDAWMGQSEPNKPDGLAYRMFHDVVKWEAYWNRISTEPTPQVDFSREFVLGVFMGPKSAGGHAIAIDSMSFNTRSRCIDCLLRMVEPEQESLLLEAVTYPGAVYRVARPPAEGDGTGNPWQLCFRRQGRDGSVLVEPMRLQ